MARPAGNADQLMIAAGKRIAREKGCSAMRIREIVDTAGVNLGMFHYHFKNRKRFTRVLLEEVYGDFFGKLTRAARGNGDALSQLRESMIVMGKFMRDERKILCALLRDILNGDLEVIRYSKEKCPPHIDLFKSLVEKCQKERRLPELPFSQILPLLFGALSQPLVIQEILDKSKKTISWFDSRTVLSDRAITQRVDIILRGLRAERI